MKKKLVGKEATEKMQVERKDQAENQIEMLRKTQPMSKFKLCLDFRVKSK